MYLGGYSVFLSSLIDVEHNAVKNVLFRAAQLIFVFGVWKLFSFIASAQNAFTSYLVFSEDYIQRTLFVASRGISKSGLLVVFFTIIVTLAGFYDTLLWALDNPGYLVKHHTGNASSIAQSLSDSPAYLLQLSGDPNTIDELTGELPLRLGAGLFGRGVNYTLTGEYDRGTPRLITPPRAFEEAGPRLWLDESGFSVGPDTFLRVATGLANTSEAYEVRSAAVSDDLWAWNGTYNNTFARSFANNVLGLPLIYWDTETELQYQSKYVSPNRLENNWQTLGQGGDTALMKQVFSLTKGDMKHTFVETAFKTSMVTNYDQPFAPDEIRDIVRRSWSEDPEQQKSPIVEKIILSMIAARRREMSYMFGLSSVQNNSVIQSNWELQNIEGNPGFAMLSLLRISTVNITLVRSDKLLHSVTPMEPCPYYYQNLAYGGKLETTDCYKTAAADPSSNQTNARFLGQQDTSAVLIMSKYFGSGRTTNSSIALDKDAFHWLNSNGEYIDNLLMSRGMIMSFGPEYAQVDVSTISPAISYLQIMLISLAVLFLIITWVALMLSKPQYSNSLLANLIDTTNEYGNGKPGYIRNVPEIVVREQQTSLGDRRKVIGTEDAVFKLDSTAVAGTSIAVGKTGYQVVSSAVV